MKRTRMENRRLGVLVCLVAVFFLTAMARLVQLQVVKHDQCREIVDSQSRGKVVIPAARGMIYDRYGRVVARDVAGSALYAYPHDAGELQRVSSFLDRYYHLKPGSAIRKFGLSVCKFRYITRRLSDEEAERIAQAAPRGLYLREQSRREYPFGVVGKQVLGFTDIDNKGQSGFEWASDSVLAGQTGLADILRDGLRNTIRVRESALVKPVRGTSVVLTADWRLQGIVEGELQAAVDEYQARSGVAVFLDCRNGDVLAMAHYDPTESDRLHPTKCRAVTDQFEPGSVLKAFTAAGLLDAGVVKLDDSIFCEEGRWKIGRRMLHDDKEHSWLTFREVFELSSNIGVAKCAIQLGGPELIETFRRFGLGEKPGCGLPGETGGVLRTMRWSEYNVASLAMGHSVAASPLQVAAGFAAIANGGDLVRPRLVLGTVDEKGYVRPTEEPESFGRAFNRSTSDSLRVLLRGVVERGTAMPAHSSSVSIAGKTGTAEIPDPEHGRYFKNRFMASFAGFFPYESPVIAGIVVLEDPRPITYGGYTAGPAFRRIAERYTVSNPDLFAVPEQTLVADARRLDRTVETPDFVGRDVVLARQMAGQRGIMLRTSVDEGTVEWQYPPPDRLVFAGDEVVVAVRPHDPDRRVMADLRGMTVRQVAALLHHQGIKFVIEGNGRVVRQSVRQGHVLSAATVCRLDCRPG